MYYILLVVKLSIPQVLCRVHTTAIAFKTWFIPNNIFPDSILGRFIPHRNICMCGYLTDFHEYIFVWPNRNQSQLNPHWCIQYVRYWDEIVNIYLILLHTAHKCFTPKRNTDFPLENLIHCAWSEFSEINCISCHDGHVQRGTYTWLEAPPQHMFSCVGI